jgi:Family of unknown function (DUF5719)
VSEFSGRRAALPSGGRIRPATVLAVAAPLLTALALVVQAPADDQTDTARRAPQTQALRAADLYCPASAKGPIRVASASDAAEKGSLTRRTPGTRTRTPVTLAAGGTATLDSDGAVLLHAEDGLAAGLVGARLGSPQPSARECSAPAGVRWFVGAGAGAAHLSTLTLANPDGGPAVADVTVWSTDGELEQVESRGLTIVGGTTSTLPLERLAPNADELAVRVIVSRGRLVSSMRDEHGKVGEDLRADALPYGAAPSRSQVLPGLTRTASSRVLTLVNPGKDEARVRLQVAGARSTFAPSGVEEIRVPAGRVVVTDLTAALKTLTAKEDLALVVASTEPVAAGLRATVSGDLVQHPALGGRVGESAAVVPETGDSALVLTAGMTGGTVRVRWGAGAEKVVELAPGTTTVVEAPKGAQLVVVDAGTPVSAVVRTQSARGAVVVPLRALVTDLLVPAVRPAWPPG